MTHNEMLAALAERQDLIATLHLDGGDLQFLTNAPFPYRRVCNLLASEPETLCWLSSAPTGAELWDIGANMGMYSLYAARICQLQVRAFEPEAGNFALLNRNIMLNQLGHQITSYCVGLSNHSGLSTLFKHLDFESSAINSIGVELDAHLQPHKSVHQQGIAVFRGDDLVTQHQLPSPSYIKIDVDGIEHLIIEGMADLLSHGCQSVLVELNINLPEHQQAMQLLQHAGLHICPELTDLTTITTGYWQGLVNLIAHRDPLVLANILAKLKHTLATDPMHRHYHQPDAAAVNHSHPEKVSVSQRSHC